MKFILGKKLNMTQVFRPDGTVVPVTRVQTGTCVITQVKTEKKDGVNAIQVGFGEQKLFRLNKPQKGHLKDLPSLRYLRDFRVDNSEHDLKRGDTYDLNSFESGEKVQVTGISKGKGFQGVVKRHGFHGSPASHGHKDQLRMPGSIGATDAARVFKGTRMGGRMGTDQVTVKNLEIIEVKPEENELLIKGAVPGARGGLLLISTKNGSIEIKKQDFSTEVKEATEVEETQKVAEEAKTEEVAEYKKEETKEEVKVEEATEENKEETKEEIE